MAVDSCPRQGFLPSEAISRRNCNSYKLQIQINLIKKMMGQYFSLLIFTAPEFCTIWLNKKKENQGVAKAHGRFLFILLM